MNRTFKIAVFAGLAGALLCASSAYALTATQAGAQIAGYKTKDGVNWTHTDPSTRNEATTVTTQVHEPSTSVTSQRNGKRVGDFDAEGVPMSLSSSGGTLILPGPDNVIPTLVTTTKQVTFDPTQGG